MRFFNFRRPFDTSSARSNAAMMGMGLRGHYALGIEERFTTGNTSFPTDYRVSTASLSPPPVVSSGYDSGGGAVQESTPDPSLPSPRVALPTFQATMEMSQGIPIPGSELRRQVTAQAAPR